MKEYYIEFYVVGNFIKVSAADPVTLKEAVVMGPLNASKEDLKKLAIQKLEYIINKANK